MDALKIQQQMDRDGEVFIATDKQGRMYMIGSSRIKIGGIMTKQGRIDKLAEWMGWKRIGGAFWQLPDGRPKGKWDPFTSRDDAHLLLLECERRMRLWEVFGLVQSKLDVGTPLIMATPEQITEAMLAVAGLGE